MALCCSPEELPPPRIVFDPDFVMIIEPRKPIKKCDYICDNIFHTDYLLSQYEPESMVGLVLISGTHSITYKITKTGDYFDHSLIKKITVELQKRQKKGGSSSARIGRIRDEKEEKYVKQVANMIINSYLENNNTRYVCSNLIISGPSELKHKVMKEPIFEQYFKGRVLEIIDSTADDGVVHKLVNDCKNIISNYVNSDFKNQLDKLNDLIRDASDKLVFGSKNIIKSLELCSLEYVFVDITKMAEYGTEIKDLASIYGCKVIVGSLMTSTGLEFAGVKFW